MTVPRGGVFVSTGSMMPFDRLIRAMDDWAKDHPTTPVFFQIGKGSYEPRHGGFVRLMPVGAYRDHLAAAALFVAHAGMGSIISAIQAGKPLVMLPRSKPLGEHNTDHQLATAATVGQRDGLHVAATEGDLAALIDRLLADTSAPPAPIAPFASAELIGHVRAFIHAAGR